MQKDSFLSKINGRDVYESAVDGDLYALDTQNGRFKRVNPKAGRHEGAFRIYDLRAIEGCIDESGGHDLRVK
ncbi:hypothetical protein WAE61_01410 [Comamonadaceae bacterium PP-2]